MSKENNGGDNINVGIELDEFDREPFEATMDSILMKSTGLCNLANKLFSKVFIDYEGSTVELMHGNNQLMVCLFFNHRDYSDPLSKKDHLENPPVLGMSKNIKDTKLKSNVLRTIRTMDRRQIEGDRFYPTEDAENLLSDFIFPQYALGSIYSKSDGKWHPNWNKIVTEVADPNTRVFSNFDNQQFTKVCFIDPIALVSVIYGKKSSKGCNYEYNVRIVSSIPGITQYNNGRDNNWLIAIERYSENKIFSLAHELNLTVPSGLNIQRSK